MGLASTFPIFFVPCYFSLVKQFPSRDVFLLPFWVIVFILPYEIHQDGPILYGNLGHQVGVGHHIPSDRGK